MGFETARRLLLGLYVSKVVAIPAETFTNRLYFQILNPEQGSKCDFDFGREGRWREYDGIRPVED